MAVGGKHVLVVAVVMLLVTYAVYEGRSSSHGDGGGVALGGRKGLSDPRSFANTPVLADDSVTEIDVTTEDATSETLEGDTLSPTLVDFEGSSEQVPESFSDEVEVEVEPSKLADSDTNADNLRAEENVDGSARMEEEEASEGASVEGKQVRELEAASGPTSAIVNPDSSNYPKPMGDPDTYLQEIAQDNTLGKQNEKLIQSCIKEDGCGTPDP